MAYAKEKWEAVFYQAGFKRLEAVVSQLCCLLVPPSVLTMSSLIPIMLCLLLCRSRVCKVLHWVSLPFYCLDSNLKLMKYRFHQITRPIWTCLDARCSSFSAGDDAGKIWSSRWVEKISWKSPHGRCFKCCWLLGGESISMTWGRIPADTCGIYQLKYAEYPTLSRIARDFLAIQGSATPSERAFSGGGITGTPNRNRLSTASFEALQVLKSAYRNGHIAAVDDAAQHVLDMDLNWLR